MLPLPGPAHALSGSARGYSHHAVRSPTRQRPSAGHRAQEQRERVSPGDRVHIISPHLSSAHAAAVAAPSPNQTNHHESSVSYGLPKNPSPSLSRGRRTRKKTPWGAEDLGRRRRRRRWRPPRLPEVNATPLPLATLPDRAPLTRNSLLGSIDAPWSRSGAHCFSRGIGWWPGLDAVVWSGGGGWLWPQ